MYIKLSSFPNPTRYILINLRTLHCLFTMPHYTVHMVTNGTQAFTLNKHMYISIPGEKRVLNPGQCLTRGRESVQ